MDLFGIKRRDRKIANLISRCNELERDLGNTSVKLNDYTVKESLGRLIEVPTKIGSNMYVIIKRETHPEYDCELIGMRRSDSKPENNIKIISITVVGYVVQPSGVYISFREQYGEFIYHIKADSPNLFLTMDAAIAEMYSNSDKSKYKYDPFIVLKQEDVLNVHNSTTIASSVSDKLPMNNLDL